VAALAVSALRIGGACLALAIVVASPAPETVLAFLGVALLLIGGVSWQWRGAALALRLAGPTVAVIGVRLLTGPVITALAAALVTLGACLGVRWVEATLGLAVFAAVVAIAGGADVRVIAGFWVLGCLVLLSHRVVSLVYRRLLPRLSHP
jgi:hypothetical protein